MAWFWSNDDESEYESYSEEESYEDANSFEDESVKADVPEDHPDNNDGPVPLASSVSNGKIPMVVSTPDTVKNDESLREEEFNLLMDVSSSSTRANGKPLVAPTKTNGSRENGHESIANGDKESKEAENPSNTNENTLLENNGQRMISPDDTPNPEEVTTFAEKQSLLVLAAEHDRVDILQAILSSNEDEKSNLLNPTESIPPPLHIAVHYGSVNAVNCLLRMGADPSLRPGAISESAVEIRDLHRFHGKTAWELAYEEPDKGGSFSSLFASTAPSKREGIRHAFTAEALRCLGADEVERLIQLLDAGLPVDSQLGGKTITEWSLDMEAVNCQKLLKPQQLPLAPRSSAVVRRSESSLASLSNRLDELENLSAGLSTCLDNLAEEVSVCSGLLLVGSGAAALATHVRSLKAQKQNISEQLERLGEAWENTEDELAYWIRECGGFDILKLQQSKSETDSPTETTENESDAEEAAKRKLKGQIAACETKIRMLRASISDLSEENTRNLEAIGQKGMTGAVTLVRGLREEIRDLEFQLSEWKSGEAASRAKIHLLQHHHAKYGKTVPEAAKTSSSVTTVESAESENTGAAPSHSTAIIVRPKHGNSSFLPMSIWQLLLRIIGFNGGDDTATARPAIIV